MCGISGAYTFTERGRSFLEKVNKANDTLVKRGPDSGDVVIKGNVALGHRRLSIIDTTCAGGQPMTTADGRYTIVFNGEIFNYKQLQQQFLTEDERRQLRSHSDTEVFLIMYSKLKEKTFELLQGFFSAAIYDSLIDELVLVRDRYGKKPLLIYLDEDKLLFASEMKALFECGVPKKMNWNILPIYFQLNYIPQPYSLIQNVQKLRPGHYMTIKIGRDIQIKSYYQLQLRHHEYQR